MSLTTGEQETSSSTGRQVMSVKNYYEIIRTSLNVITATIGAREGDTSVDSTLFSGRKGSAYFEDDFLKPLIQKHEQELLERINDQLSHNPYKFIRVDASESTNEAQSRSIADVSVFIQREEKATEEYINIKATAGNTADNVGSWESLNHVLYGHESSVVKQRSALLKKIADTPLNDSISDYFLWVFNKNEPTVKKIMDSASVHSMLGSSLSSFYINMSQNYPVQFKSHNAEQLLFDDNTDIKELKKQLSMKILESGKKFHEEQSKIWTQAYKALS